MQIVALYEELGSYRAVAAVVGCDHKTVKRYVELAGELGQLAPTATRARVTDEFGGLIRERVEQSRGWITARRLLRVLRAAGYDGTPGRCIEAGAALRLAYARSGVGTDATPARAAVSTTSRNSRWPK